MAGRTPRRLPTEDRRRADHRRPNGSGAAAAPGRGGERVELMTNRIRPYAWGSRTAIAELLGQPSPADHPQAELWIGAHPGDPSQIGSPDAPRSLADHVEADPQRALGSRQAAEFGRLPFLLKVLAAAEPLSLQAHPSREQAEAGFALEQAAGVDIRSAERNYKDTWPKPELVCALTTFHALCGFRDPGRTVTVLSQLQCPELDRYLTLLSGQPDSAGVRALFSSIITMPPAALTPVIDAVLAGCVDRLRAGSEFGEIYRTALDLGERYPGDPGVLASLLMNRVTLQPGQALYLGAGNLHAYLAGTAVEIMANSDNVLRGGLTPKHVDVAELMRVLDFTTGDVQLIDPVPDGVGRWRYPTPAKEFALTRVAAAGVTDGVPLPADGAQVLLVVAGTGVLRSQDAELTVPKGRSAWLDAPRPGSAAVRLFGDAVGFVATDGLD